MDLVGAWLRQLLKAGTAAALVPAAMVAALVVVIVGAGGFGGLGSIGQILTGPRISPAERVDGAGAARERDLAPVAPPAARQPVRRAVPVPSAPRTRPPRTATPPPAPPPPPPPAAPPAPVPVAPVVPPRAPAPPPPAPARPATVPQRLKQDLKDTVGALGTVVADIITGLGKTLGLLLNLPPPPGS